jgi:hypothetical protein
MHKNLWGRFDEGRALTASAIGLSVARKESTERFKISASRSLTRLGSGRESTARTAKLPTSRRELRGYMMI